MCVCLLIENLVHCGGATVILRAGGFIWLNPLATVLLMLFTAVVVECLF